MTNEYIGRFAPSPTGPLHIGSLITALASYLDARHHHGKWLVRIDDIDPLREQLGAANQILQCLQTHGLTWDEAITYQSQRIDLYQSALQQLLSQQQAYYCTCSRKDLQQHTNTRCRCINQLQPPNPPFAIRIHVTDALPTVNDRWQGSFALPKEPINDFVIWRKEGYVAYQLAAAIDDAAQHITHVVRGSDLLESTPKQMYIQQCLALPTPYYGHIPVICNTLGQKLSKQTFAKPINGEDALQNLRFALQFLKQPINTKARTVTQLLSYAITHWDDQIIPRQMTILCDQ